MFAPIVYLPRLIIETALEGLLLLVLVAFVLCERVMGVASE